MTSKSCPDHAASMVLGHRKDELAGDPALVRWHWICPAGHTVPAAKGEEPASTDPRVTFPA